ncbi:MAG: ATP synthase F0 subunit B [Holophagaceae bacterium]|uniref:ATP synthase subunit b n=1 Tax=Candidatus Geothrix skivensis TaxID=2954439 RepID=A0A9D7XHW2_9BACT|nr:ATP synthase F0 subunit B [Candidatus Geothrix skivensis]
MNQLTRLSLAVLLSLSPLALAAQAHAVPAGPAADKHGTPAAEKPAAPAASHEAKPADGHVGEAHGAATHEAAPGHGAAQGAHHGPAMTLFGKEYGKLGAFLVQLLNFAIYGAGLFFLLKGALSAMFKSRKEELETMLAQAERDKAEGEAQLKDMETKMTGLETELAGILSKAQADAEVEKQRVLEAARAEAEVILSQAQTEIGYQKRQAEQELRALVAELAVEGAAKRLEAKLLGPEAASAVDRAIQQIGGAQ